MSAKNDGRSLLCAKHLANTVVDELVLFVQLLLKKSKIVRTEHLLEFSTIETFVHLCICVYTVVHLIHDSITGIPNALGRPLLRTTFQIILYTPVALSVA